MGEIFLLMAEIKHEIGLHDFNLAKIKVNSDNLIIWIIFDLIGIKWGISNYHKLKYFDTVSLLLPRVIQKVINY